MDPATIAVAGYGVETAAEAGVAAYFVTKPTLPLKARLEHIASDTPLPRSSHSLTVIGDRAIVFGGEIEPRKPVGNEVEVLNFEVGGGVAGTGKKVTVERIPAKGAEAKDGGGGGGEDVVPVARVGHTAVGARNRVFVFGGRGGADMTALPENGRIWVFDPEISRWLFLDPPPETYSPCARSYHSSVASSDGNAIFIQAGCASDGTRLSDTWAFYFDEGKWTRLADAPDPPRGGPSLAYGQGKLWRFGGYDGKSELGGQLDYLELPASRSIGQPGKDVDDNAEWKTLPFSFDTEDSTSSSTTIPGNRSLAALHHITTGQGRDYLILALGEGDPSAIGHAGAGKFYQDIWAYQLPPSSFFTGAGVKDAIRERMPGLGSTKGQWARVDVTGMEVSETEKGGGKWTGRGWFGSDMTGGKQFMVWGGIDEGNERLGDGWMIVVE